MHNRAHAISEYQLLYGRFHLYNSPSLTYDACKKLGLYFQFWNTNIFLKNLVNMGNKLPDNIEECVILELGEIILFATHTMFCDGICGL